MTVDERCQVRQYWNVIILSHLSRDNGLFTETLFFHLLCETAFSNNDF